MRGTGGAKKVWDTTHLGFGRGREGKKWCGGEGECLNHFQVG